MFDAQQQATVQNRVVFQKAGVTALLSQHAMRGSVKQKKTRRKRLNIHPNVPTLCIYIFWTPGSFDFFFGNDFNRQKPARKNMILKTSA